MAFTIPDKGEGQDDIQSILFQEHLEVLVAGIGPDRVVSGCAVTAQGSPNMTVAVATGVVISNSVTRNVTGANATITTAHATLKRIDLVVIDAAGAIAVRAGTAAAAPKPPVRTANDVVLAQVFVSADDTTITGGVGGQIDDKRVINSGLLAANNLSDVTAATARTNLGAAPLASPTFTGTVTLAQDPASALQAVTRQYADGLAVNMGKRQRVRTTSTANITIATALNNGDVLNGVTLATNDIVMVPFQTAQEQNGIFVVGAVPARFSEFDTYNEHPGSLISVAEGTLYADSVWLCTSNQGGTLDTTPIVFSQWASGGGLLAANNLSDLASSATARTNLGVAIGTNVDAFADTVSQAEAQGGTGTSVRNWTSQRVAQAIAALAPATSNRWGCVNVKDVAYGAVGNGVANDRTAITNAFADSRHVHFPAGTYYCGTIATAANLFGNIDGAGGPITISTEGLVKFTCNTTAAVLPTFFSIFHASSVRIGDVSFEDLGYPHTTAFHGAIGVKLSLSVGQPIEDVDISSIHSKNMVASLMVLGTVTTRARGIHVGLVYAERCLYGVNFQNNGDGCAIDLIHSIDVRRIVFVYGVQGFKATVYSLEPANSSAHVNISAYDAGYDTKDIDVKLMVRYTGTAGNSPQSWVNMAMIGEGSRRIERVKLDLDIESNGWPENVRFQAFDVTGGTENFGVTNNVFTNIEVKGRLAVLPVDVWQVNIYCQPTTKGTLTLGDGLNHAQIAPAVHNNFILKSAGHYLGLQQLSKSAAYTTVLTDAGKHLLHPSADTTSRIWTINSNANVPYPLGTELTFVNQASGGTITIAITTDTMRLAGAGTTGNRSLAANGIARALKVTATEWLISGTGLT